MPPDHLSPSLPPDPGPGVPARFKLGTASFENVNAPAGGGPPPVEVGQILRDNLARANSAGLNELAPMPPHRSRRRRDYWLILVSANLFFGLIAVCSGPSAPLPFVAALSGMALVSGGLTWLMWFVMDDY